MPGRDAGRDGTITIKKRPDKTWTFLQALWLAFGLTVVTGHYLYYGPDHWTDTLFIVVVLVMAALVMDKFREVARDETWTFSRDGVEIMLGRKRRVYAYGPSMVVDVKCHRVARGDGGWNDHLAGLTILELDHLGGYHEILEWEGWRLADIQGLYDFLLPIIDEKGVRTETRFNEFREGQRDYMLPGGPSSGATTEGHL